LIAFLDADDLWLPRKLELQLKTCADFAISYTNSVYFGAELADDIVKSSISDQYSGQVLDKLIVANFITGSSVLIRKEVFHRHGGFDSTYGCVQDWPLWIRICAEHPLGYVPEPLVRYRVHADATSMKVRKTLPAHMRVLQEAFAPGGAAAHMPRRIMHQAFTSSFLINAQYAARSNDRLFAVGCAVKALSYAPLELRAWKECCKTTLFLLRVRAY
jgi:hypothetical protein